MVVAIAISIVTVTCPALAESTAALVLHGGTLDHVSVFVSPEKQQGVVVVPMEAWACVCVCECVCMRVYV